jgi:hypothetical protein
LPAGRLLVAAVSALFVLTVVVWALVALVAGGQITAVDDHCAGREFSCGIAAGVFSTLVPAIAAFGVFIVGRYLRVWRRYRAGAQAAPHRLLQAPKPLGPIVGRDDLCRVVLEELGRREEDVDDSTADGDGTLDDGTGRGRRAVVLVGGVGAGKTAVLIRLTQLIAETDMVPIPIRLRHAQDRLDFEELAREKFLREARRVSAAEAEPVWRYLLENDQVVVIADGLEEALTRVVESRETAIKVAFDDARDRNLPLVVASRPHNVLDHLDIRLLRVEPLVMTDALEYIRGPDAAAERRVQEIAQRAEVVEMPLFMQITRQLHDKGLLDGVNARQAGRIDLRVDLLREWVNALQRGQIEPSVALTPERRGVVIEKLSSLACVGLLNDDLVVSFGHLAEGATIVGGAQPSGNGVERDRREEIARIVAAGPRELRAVAADGARLGLVDPIADGIRFRHSTVQAYLGSLRIHEFFTGTARELLLEKLRDPGRELLMALEMRCAGSKAACGPVIEVLADAVTGNRLARTLEPVAPPEPAGSRGTVATAAAAPPAATAGNGLLGSLRRRLQPRAADEDVPSSGPVAHEPPPEPAPVEAGRSARDGSPPGPMEGWKAVMAASSAVAVHSLSGDDGGAEEVDDLVRMAWRNARTSTTATNDAKLSAILRVEEANRYEALWQICNSEHTYRVRLYAARNLGSGGMAAFEALGERLDAIADISNAAERRAPPTRAKARALMIERRVVAAPTEADPDADDRQPDRGYALQGLLLPQLLQSVGAQRPPASAEHFEHDAGHLEVDAREADDAGGGVADETRKAAAHMHEAARRARGDEWERERSAAVRRLRRLLADWVRAAGERRLYRTSQLALVQGFKHAANRRPPHRPDSAELDSRAFLARQAETLLESEGTFWFTRIALIQALTLWLLAETEDRKDDPQTIVDTKRRLDRWVGDSRHPFVVEAAALCASALEERSPAKYIWAEEVDVVAKLGPSADCIDRIDDRQLDSRRWIPRSAGWLTLHPRAQQLVAGVIMMLNLSDRGDTTEEREDRLELVAQDGLPPCLTRPRGREYLRVARPLDDPQAGAPGTTCHPDCDMHLCPYPAPGDELSREELGEAFCRQQQKLLRGVADGPLRRKKVLHPPWQLGIGVDELAAFWADMERRARR